MKGLSLHINNLLHDRCLFLIWFVSFVCLINFRPLGKCAWLFFFHCWFYCVFVFFVFLFFLYQFLRVNVFLVCFEFEVCRSQREQNICFLDTQTKKSNDTQIVKTDVYSPSIFVSINWNTTCKMDTSWLLISFLLRENFELAQPKAKKKTTCKSDLHHLSIVCIT